MSPHRYTPGHVGRFHAVDVIALYVVIRLVGTGAALILAPADSLYSHLVVVGGATFFGVVMAVVGVLLAVSYTTQRALFRRSPELFMAALAAASVYITLSVLYLAVLGVAALAATLPTALMAFWLAAEGRPPWRGPVPPVVIPAE